MVNYLNALKYPVTNIKSFLIGALLSFFSIFFIPFLLVQGYIVRIIRETNKGSNVMPNWEDWKELLHDGFFVFAVEVAYLLPSLLLYTLATFITTQNLTSAIMTGTILKIGTIPIVLILVSSILMFVALIILPLAIVIFALTKEFKSAFDLINLAKTILTEPLNYFLTLIVSFIVVLAFLATFPVTSVVLGALLFYPIVFTFRIVAGWFTEMP